MKSNYYEYRDMIAYDQALRYQSFLVSEGYSGLFCFQSQETITLGRASKNDDLLVSNSYLRDNEITLLATDRGGRATWHGPGQLVGFPLIDLSDYYRNRRAIRRFTEDLMMGLAQACASIGVKEISMRNKYPGLWTPKGKLVSLGISVKDGVVYHGFALNVSMATKRGFSLINPCGIVNCNQTSLEEEGVSVAAMRELGSSLTNYLPMLFLEGMQCSLQQAEKRYDSLVNRVAKTTVALEHLSSALKKISSHEKY